MIQIQIFYIMFDNEQLLNKMEQSFRSMKFRKLYLQIMVIVVS